MTQLQIAPKVTFPVEAVTQTFAILGKRGSGKTTTATVLVEELLAAHQQVIVIDPLDVTWGLRSSRDGARAGFPITVLGGDHADLPLEATAGAVLAEFVVTQRASIILSLRHFSIGDQRRFATDFCERLYALKGQTANRTPLHVVIDECDEFCPQRIPAGQERLFGAVDRLVRRGRSAGIGVTLISQRAAVVNKDVLSQAEVLICHQTISPQDRKALEAWIEAHDAHGQGEAFMASLASLSRGEAWVWSPGWLDLFVRAQIRDRKTFDSSATPTAGKVVAPKALAPVDLEALKQQIAATIEKAKADDPRELRKHLAEKDQRIKALERVTSGFARSHEGKKPEALTDADRALLGKVAEAIAQAASLMHEDLVLANQRLRSELTHALEEYGGRVALGVTTANQMIEKTLAKVSVQKVLSKLEYHNPVIPADAQKPAPNYSESMPRHPAGPTLSAATRPAETRSPSGPDGMGVAGTLPPGEHAVLTAALQYPTGLDRKRLGILTGYKKSSRDTYILRLAQKGLVRVEGGRLVATQAGADAMGGQFEPLPTGAALVAYWRQRLPEGERATLDVLLEAGPGGISREAIDEATGYKKSSRDTYLLRLRARGLVEVAGRGQVQASAVLFE